MLTFLEDSDAAKVSMRELEEQVLSPNESGSILCALLGKQEMTKEQIGFRYSDKEKKNSHRWQGEMG